MKPDKNIPRGEQPSFEGYSLTRQEYLNVMTHFYRGESARATTWRERLDTTTNWAVFTSAGILSFTFSNPRHEHVLIILSNVVLLFFLLIEARRYRYFEVYRARVRMLEENFLAPIVTRQLDSPMSRWRYMVSRDLHQPRFKTTLLEAVGFRLRRNYLFIFIMIFCAWWLKLTMHPTHVSHYGELYQRMAIGWLPAWAVMGFQVLFILVLTAIAFYPVIWHTGVAEDEIRGLEPKRKRWKF